MMAVNGHPYEGKKIIKVGVPMRKDAHVKKIWNVNKGGR